jgi:hypothetical protein
MAGTVAQLALAVGLLLALVFSLSRAYRWATGREPRHRRLKRRFRLGRRLPPAPGPTRRPIQLVAADLRRLARQLALVPAGAPLVRWQALWVAYDDVLREAAAQLEIPHDLQDSPRGPAHEFERRRLVAALEGAGLAVRD